MNDTVKYLIGLHEGPVATVYAGVGFDNLTESTSCTYLLGSDNRILSVILDTDADEPLDEVCDFFIQQMWLAKEPSNRMLAHGLRPMYGDVLIARLALENVPEWQRDVIQARIRDALNVVYTRRETHDET